MADTMEDLRKEIERLKKAAEIQDARIWALADFFGQLNSALAGNADKIQSEFMTGVQNLYRTKPSTPEEEIQKGFRSSTFD